MLKGISRQVIVVDAPETKFFEQAIFILRDGSPAVSDEMLLKEAEYLIRTASSGKRRRRRIAGPIWACGGASIVAIAWVITLIW